jgi:predicted nuclease of restriction endonuclease-like (RecB) superfamily
VVQLHWVCAASESARQWYMNEGASQGWTTRALDRQINTLYYERLLSSSDRPAVEAEAKSKLAHLQTPRDFVRDPLMLEFLGLPGVGKLLEADLERALLDNLQAFLLELGRGFAFVGRQYRISSESKDFYIDLVFYNYLLECFMLFDLKSGELTHQDVGQMDMYVLMVDDLSGHPTTTRPWGSSSALKRMLLLCATLFFENEQIFASRYKLILPTEE